MCNSHHHHSPPAGDKSPRQGTKLSDGSAQHQSDHNKWQRRSFLKTMGIATAGASVVLGGNNVQAMANNSFFKNLAADQSNRRIVFIQLAGGNDGLNTLVQKNNDLYYNMRGGTAAQGGLAIDGNNTLSLTDDIGIHPSFSDVHPMWEDGNMAIVQNVGYPNPIQSHFRSTDIIFSGKDSDVFEDSGTLGRYFATEYPDFETSKPDFPLAVQVGGFDVLLFQGPNIGMGMSMVSPSFFEAIANDDAIYPVTGLDNTAYGDETGYLRSVANDSYLYADAIHEAASTGANTVEYPSPNANNLSRTLPIVAQLIKGDLGSKIYHVSITGFDTHAGQLDIQANLLKNISEIIPTFFEDLAQTGHDEDTLVVTLTEFGRRPEANQSNGTDHGTSSPMFIFGAGAAGGMYGTPPDLADLDDLGNLKHSTDFRSVYSTLLQHWFGLEPENAADIFDGDFTTVPFISDPAQVGNERSLPPVSFSLEQNYPNPVSSITQVPFALNRSANVEMNIYDLQGRQAQSVINERRPAGQHVVTVNAQNLSSGTYLLQLTIDGTTRSQTMTVIR